MPRAAPSSDPFFRGVITALLITWGAFWAPLGLWAYFGGIEWLQ